MPVHDADGDTMYPFSEKSFRNLLPTALASSQNPALNAGWPQQVCPGLYETLQPAFSSTLIVLKAVSGYN